MRRLTRRAPAESLDGPLPPPSILNPHNEGMFASWLDEVEAVEAAMTSCGDIPPAADWLPVETT